MVCSFSTPALPPGLHPPFRRRPLACFTWTGRGAFAARLSKCGAFRSQPATGFCNGGHFPVGSVGLGFVGGHCPPPYFSGLSIWRAMLAATLVSIILTCHFPEIAI